MDQHIELETLGILRQTKVPKELAWLDKSDKQLLLLLLLQGEGGLHKSAVKKFEKKAPDAIVKISANGLADWQTDKQGRPVALCLTWKGTEAAELLLVIARNENKKGN